MNRKAIAALGAAIAMGLGVVTATTAHATGSGDEGNHPCVVHPFNVNGNNDNNKNNEDCDKSDDDESKDKDGEADLDCTKIRMDFDSILLTIGQAIMKHDHPAYDRLVPKFNLILADSKEDGCKDAPKLPPYPTPSPSPSPSPSASPSPVSTPTPTAKPTPVPTAVPTPTASPSPVSTSSSTTTTSAPALTAPDTGANLPMAPGLLLIIGGAAATAVAFRRNRSSK